MKTTNLEVETARHEVSGNHHPNLAKSEVLDNRVTLSE
jgi:hypothetical protein